MKSARIAAVICMSGLLAGCGALENVSRRDLFTGGGAVAGGALGVAVVSGAPGATTAMIAGATVGAGVGYAVEYFTRPAPPGSAPR